MAVQTTFMTGAGAKNYGVAKQHPGQEAEVVRYIDASANNLTSGDYYRLFYYEADTELRDFRIVTETVEGASDTTDLTDDETGTNVLVSNADLNTDNNLAAQSTAVFKAAAGYVCVRPDAAIGTAKFWVSGKMKKYSTTVDR